MAALFLFLCVSRQLLRIAGNPPARFIAPSCGNLLQPPPPLPPPRIIHLFHYRFFARGINECMHLHAYKYRGTWNMEAARQGPRRRPPPSRNRNERIAEGKRAPGFLPGFLPSLELPRIRPEQNRAKQRLRIRKEREKKKGYIEKKERKKERKKGRKKCGKRKKKTLLINGVNECSHT